MLRLRAWHRFPKNSQPGSVQEKISSNSRLFTTAVETLKNHSINRIHKCPVINNLTWAVHNTISCERTKHKRFTSCYLSCILALQIKQNNIPSRPGQENWVGKLMSRIFNCKHSGTPNLISKFNFREKRFLEKLNKIYSWIVTCTSTISFTCQKYCFRFHDQYSLLGLSDLSLFQQRLAAGKACKIVCPVLDTSFQPCLILPKVR